MRWSWSGHDAGIVCKAWRLSLWVTVCLKLTRLPCLPVTRDDPRLDGAFTMYYMSRQHRLLLLYAGERRDWRRVMN